MAKALQPRTQALGALRMAIAVHFPPNVAAVRPARNDRPIVVDLGNSDTITIDLDKDGWFQVEANICRESQYASMADPEICGQAHVLLAQVLHPQLGHGQVTIYDTNGVVLLSAVSIRFHRFEAANPTSIDQILDLIDQSSKRP